MSFSVRIAAGAFAAAAIIGVVASAGGAQTAAADHALGEQTYGEVCAACHMPDGKGNPPAIPALAGDANLADTKLPLDRILHGKGGMPAFADLLTPEQIVAVTNYVRTTFGNNFQPAVSADDVKKAGTPG